MWAPRPFHHDNDMPIDLRKKVVLQRDRQESSPDSRTESTFTPAKDGNQMDERWRRPPVTVLPVGNLYPFVSEKYMGRCSLVTATDENVGHDVKYGSRGALEAAIRKLHNNRQSEVAEPSKEERCRSTDIALDTNEKDASLDGKRSSSCPNLTVIKPKPSPIKPKSSFIQRSSGYISDTISEPNHLPVTSSNFPHDPNEHSISHPKCGAKKRKSFIPVYGDRAPSPKRPLSSEENISHEKRRPLDLVRNEDYFLPRRPRSPFEREDYYSHSEKRPQSPGEEYSFHSDRRTRSPCDEYSFHSDRRTRSPVDKYFYRPEKRPRSPVDEYYSRPEKIRPRSPLEHEEYFSHPEVLLRRQLQQHSPSPYLVHVYDYYQQLVQRMREHSSPGMRVPPPVSPPSGDEDTQLDGQRKRPCRALTGKHVRQGTGASISTLLTLRQKIQERQKAKDSEPRTGLIGNSNRNGSPKKIKSQKIKNKNPLQIQKC